MNRDMSPKDDHESLNEEFLREFQKSFCTVTDLPDIVYTAACCEYPVLITGETGTGKELIAKAIHAQGVRANGPLVAINCALIPKENLYAELFGVAKRAYSNVDARSGLIETADNGTIFLDEIGDLPADAQAGLLRVLETGEVKRLGDTESAKSKKVNVRVIAATNRDVLDEKIMRPDLVYRIRVIPISVEPLRHRPEDIPLILANILERFGVLSVDFHFYAFCISNFWRGNVRELKNFCSFASLRTNDNHLDNPFFNRAMDFFPFKELNALEEHQYFLNNPPFELSDSLRRLLEVDMISEDARCQEGLNYLRFLRQFQTKISKRKSTLNYGVRRVECTQFSRGRRWNVISHVYPSIDVADIPRHDVFGISERAPKNPQAASRWKVAKLTEGLVNEAGLFHESNEGTPVYEPQFPSSFYDALASFESKFFKGVFSRYLHESDHAIGKIIGLDAKTVRVKRDKFT